MAVPVINTTQSVLGYLQWQAFEFLPTATGSPTLWSCDALPTGLYFSTTTGLITGAAIYPGVYNFTLYAENAAGRSAAASFVMGIEASTLVPDNSIEIVVDVVTRIAYLGSGNAIANQAAATAAATAADASEPAPALFMVKRGDDLMLVITFVKGGSPINLPLTSVKFALKEFEPDGILIESSDFRLVTLTQGRVARVYAKIESAALTAALSNYEDDAATQFPALAEIEWVEDNLTSPQIGPVSLRSTSRSFTVMVPRDIIPNS